MLKRDELYLAQLTNISWKVEYLQCENKRKGAVI